MVGQIMMMRKDQQMGDLGSLQGTGEELHHVLQSNCSQDPTFRHSSYTR